MRSAATAILALGFVLGTTTACGGNKDDGDKGDPNASQHGGGGVSPDSLEESRGRFELSGEIDATIECDTGLAAQSGFNTYSSTDAEGNTRGELETVTHSVICFDDENDDQTVGIELHEVDTKRDQKVDPERELTWEPSTYEFIGSPNDLDRWREEGTFASITVDGFDGPIVWDERSGTIEIQSMAVDAINDREALIATVQAEFQDDDKRLSIQGAINDPVKDEQTSSPDDS